MVERCVREGDGLCGGLHELRLSSEPAPRDCEHLVALVEPGDAEFVAQELGGDEARSRRDVEDVATIRWKPRDEEAPPERILAEREHRSHSVVGRAEGGEERSGVGGSRRHDSYSGDVGLAEDIERAASLASAHAESSDVVSGVIPTEPTSGGRVFLCAFDDADGRRSWLGVRDDGGVVDGRAELREAVSIAALCEVATDAAGGGDLDALIASLEELQATEAPPGIEAAVEAALELRDVLALPPQLATPSRLDDIGTATRRLERELDPTGASPFAAALKSSQDAVGELQREIEAGYRVPLS